MTVPTLASYARSCGMTCQASLSSRTSPPTADECRDRHPAACFEPELDRSRNIKRRVTDTCGVSIIEFALVVPILMLVVFAAIDFTRAYYTQNQVASAARAGARFAAVQSNPMASQAQIRQVVRQFGAQLGGSGITDSQIQIAMNSATGEITVSVVNYPFSLITPLARTVGAGTIPITKRATFRWEWS